MSGKTPEDQLDEAKAAELARRLFALPKSSRKDRAADSAKPARKPKSAKGKA